MAISSGIELVDTGFTYPKLMTHRKRGNVALMQSDHKGMWLTGSSIGQFQTDLRIQDFTDFTGNLVMFNTPDNKGESSNGNSTEIDTLSVV